MKYGWFIATILLLLTVLIRPTAVMAQGEVLGIHILNPSEIEAASKLLEGSDSEEWRAVTIPLSLNDLEKKQEWEDFFRACKEKKLTPIVRLTSRFEKNSWQVPTFKEIVQQIAFLNDMPWPNEERFIIVFNEPNHAKEWGGQVDPASYAKILNFTAQWAKAVNHNFKVLPGAVDLAANNSQETMDAFKFLDLVMAAEPEVINRLDYWNSHSYPNPGFSAAPQATGRNSLRGFQHELAYIKAKTGRDFDVFITETGWVETNWTRKWLVSYYQYAADHIWSDPRVKAVTPFLLQGAPGPFATFSFLNAQGNPTKQYEAFKLVVK